MLALLRSEALFALIALPAATLALGSCGEDALDPAAACTLADGIGGAISITCADGIWATVAGGDLLADQPACWAAADRTITCEDRSGLTMQIADGDDGSGCFAVDNGDGTSTVECDDGTSAVIGNGGAAGGGCDFEYDDLEALVTVTCGDELSVMPCADYDRDGVCYQRDACIGFDDHGDFGGHACDDSVIRNPRFDTDASGWQLGAGDVRWTADGETGGGLRLTVSDPATTHAVAEACVGDSAGSASEPDSMGFVGGGMVRVRFDYLLTDSLGSARAGYRLLNATQPDCTGLIVTDNIAMDVTGEWTTVTLEMETLVATVGLSLQVDLADDSASPRASVVIDNVRVTGIR